GHTWLPHAHRVQFIGHRGYANLRVLHYSGAVLVTLDADACFVTRHVFPLLHPYTLTHTHSHTLTHTITHTLSLSLTHTLTQTHTHTETHTHTHTHSHSHSQTHS